MVRDNSERSSGQDSTILGHSRRSVLKVAGVGTGLAALGGVGVTGADESGSGNGDADENGGGNGNGGENDDDDGDDGDDPHFVADLIDPTFGYPLAADETDDVDLDHVVELYTEEGAGSHDGFPVDPQSGEEAPFEFAFDPVGIHVEPDSVVQFHTTAGEHTATAVHEKFSIPMREVPTRVPDGVPGFTSPPIVDGESWLYQFPTRGVYDVMCLPHLFAGMVMRIVVLDPEEDDVEDDAFAAPTAGELPPSAEQVLATDELDPANIVEAGTVAWEDLTLGAGPTVQVREHEEYGDILVGPDGMTLYVFDNDEQGEGSSTCTGDCAEAWPPLTVEGDPSAGEGVEAELTTFEREGGATQVAANGWPLYYFAQDEQPGDANGQGVSDVWWVVRPDGTPVTSNSSG